jgi:hypothetical protein
MIRAVVPPTALKSRITKLNEPSLQADQKEAELDLTSDNALIRYAVCRMENRAAQAGAVRPLKAKPGGQ